MGTEGGDRKGRGGEGRGWEETKGDDRGRGRRERRWEERGGEGGEGREESLGRYNIVKSG